MNRFFAIAITGLVATVSVVRVYAGVKDTNSLRNASIPEETLKKISTPVPIHPNSEDEVVCTGSAQRILPLTRPGESNIVAVLAIVQEKTAILNPKGPNEFSCDYGCIPLLEKMTIAQTDELWGSSAKIKQPVNWRTYKLTAAFNRDFFIDLTFNNNKQIEKYRVRSHLLASSAWHQVQ